MKKLVATILSCALLASLTGAADAEETQVEETAETSYEEVVESLGTEETAETSFEDLAESLVVEESVESSTVETTELSVEETEVTQESETTEATEVTEETAIETSAEETSVETPVAEEVFQNLYDFESAPYYDGESVSYLITDGCLRLTPDPNGEVVAELSANSPVNVTGVSVRSPWLRCNYNGQVCYVNMMNTYTANCVSTGDVLSEEEAEYVWALMYGLV